MLAAAVVQMRQLCARHSRLLEHLFTVACYCSLLAFPGSSIGIGGRKLHPLKLPASPAPKLPPHKTVN